MGATALRLSAGAGNGPRQVGSAACRFAFYTQPRKRPECPKIISVYNEVVCVLVSFEIILQ